MCAPLPRGASLLALARTASGRRLGDERPLERLDQVDRADGCATGVSQYGQICQTGSSGAVAGDARLASAGSCRPGRRGTPRRRGAGRPGSAPRPSAEPLLDRPDLELALAHVVEVLRRAEEHVDERTEERRHEAEQRRQRDEPRVLDPPASVLVDPEADREPEDDAEGDRPARVRDQVRELKKSRSRAASRGKQDGTTEGVCR